jgi:branched-chain amino acid transport system ATP-binding protein
MTPAVLRLEGLQKRFGAIEVTRSVSLDVKAGEIHALIGPNGAGKSTLVAQIAGQLPPDVGSIWLNGENVTAWSPQRRARKGLGRTFQISSVFRSLSAADNVEVALNARRGRASPWRRFGQGASRQAAQAELDRLHIDADERRVGALGYGTIRQLELAMGLALSPTVLLLDEPLAGLSSAEAERVVELLGTLRGRIGMLLIEHDMDAVFALADRVTVLVSGAVIACGTPAEIRADAAVRQAYLGQE